MGFKGSPEIIGLLQYPRRGRNQENRFFIVGEIE